MSKDFIKDVQEMHTKFDIPINDVPSFLSSEKIEGFRSSFIFEEYSEYIDALEAKDLEEQIDALIDIIVVSIGTLDMMGVDIEAHWNEVHRANMAKFRITDSKDSKRGSDIDLGKPEGWVGPDHTSILEDS